MKIHTSPPALTTLLNGLKKIWPKTPTSTSFFTESWCQSIVDSQEDIGWWPLICGRWSVQWRHFHSEIYKRIGSLRSSRRWQKAVINLLLNTAWDFWQFRNTKNNEPNQNTQETRLLKKEIKYQWNLGPPTVFELQYFCEPLDTLLKKQNAQKEIWLLRITTARPFSQTDR